MLAVRLQLFESGKEHSQNLQPFTGCPVIETAAADGDVYLLPFIINAPLTTSAVNS
jgi:hypothetical protein